MPATSLEELTGRHPASVEVPAATVREQLPPDRTLIVLDDDPTGTQSVADLPVLTDGTAEALTWALQQGAPAVYVLTNSRSLDPDEAERINVRVARAAFEAAAATGRTIDLVSRSDSTLRGHFPLEPLVLADESRTAGQRVDGIVVVPAFPDAGRITVDGTHYAGSPEAGYTPVGETEYARDATFGYTSSHLPDWIAERAAGTDLTAETAYVDLTTLRTDPDTAAAILGGARDAQPVVCDIVDESDLRRLALAIRTAERAGSRFVYRVGPPFVRALIGQDVHPPLEPADLAEIRAGGPAADAVGGLVVIGSHVSMTTRQLDVLRERRAPYELEVDVHAVLHRPEEHVDELADAATAALERGTVILRTSRTLVTGADAQESLAIARRVSAALTRAVRRTVAQGTPRFVVAKGGITSSDVAAHGLEIDRAIVRGPMLPGIVSLWDPVDGPARGIPYIVFAGNVGQEDSLADVVDKLSR